MKLRVMGVKLALIAAFGTALTLGACSDGGGGGGGGDSGADTDGSTDEGGADADTADGGMDADGGEDGGGGMDIAGDTDTADASSDAGDTGDTDTGEDADTGEEGGFTGPFAEVKASEVDQVLDFDALRSVVHLARDSDGVPHIFADNAYDAFFAQGYIHAKDRFVQMLLIRGNVGGTLAKLVGSLDEDSIGDDIFQRVLGFRRIAQRTWDEMEEGPVKETIQAYCDGINAYIGRLKAGEESVPSAFGILANKNTVELWQPADVLTLAKYQIYDLGFDAFGEISRTAQRAAVASKFSPDAEDPAFARRAGIMEDLARFAPADPTYQVDGFTGNAWAGGAMPALPALPSAKAPWKAPNLAMLERVADALSRPHSEFAMFQGPPEGASNSWVVRGSLTETGNAMLANDPHLSTNSPPLFHAVHLVVEPGEAADEPAMNLYGLQFPGLPGILLGHTEHLAWGLTTSGHDYTDAYQETLVWKEGEEWPRVLHDGQEVELDIVEETIEVGISGTVTSTVTVKIPIVPHRGPLAPQFDGNTLLPPSGDTAISLAWRGFQPSAELEAIYGWWTAQNVHEAMEAMRKWSSASQHVVFVDREGNIGYGVDGEIPVRPTAALSWHPTNNPDGYAPWWVLNGTGEHDWLEEPLSRDLTPNAYNPENGYVVTANNDATGVTDDNDPLNDYEYIGYDYDIGFRAGRITRRLEEAAAGADKVTLEEMGAIQSDYFSNLGERLLPFLLEAGNKLVTAYDDDTAYPELNALVAANAGKKEQVVAALALLEGWTLLAEDGKWGTPTPAHIADANATALFNFWMVAVTNAAFGDERAHVPGLGDQLRAKGLLHILEHPTTCATYDPATGQSALWDDMTSTESEETRDQVLAAGVFKALAELEAKWGSADPSTWIWGDTHTKQFSTLVPLGGGADYTWPLPAEGWGSGFPRHGDNFNVDACNGGTGDYSFSCGGVALQRLLVEATPDGMVSYNALPGGQVWDKDSPYFRNQLPLWLDNERRPSWLTAEQILGELDAHWVLQPK